jgi:hypothetical protein
LKNQLLFYRLYGSCQRCPQHIEWLLGAFLAGIVIVALIGYRMHKKKVDLGIFSIGIDYFQVLAIFAGTEVEWPQSIRELYRYLSVRKPRPLRWHSPLTRGRSFQVVNFNINITPPECAFEVSYRLKWLVIEWFPTAMFTVVGNCSLFPFLFFFNNQ